MRLEEVASKKDRRMSKKTGPPSPAFSAVQRLYDVCKEVFANLGAGIVPESEDVERIRSVLDDMDLKDVGLSENMPYFRHAESRGLPPITYLHIYECNKFSMGIFCLPPGGVIPLHNHPGMTVFSKLLFGSMHIKSYDWVDASQCSGAVICSSEFQDLRLAKLQNDDVFIAPCKTSVLYPADGGNMHRFTAITACAVLDVLGPPYSTPEEGRDCTYYNDFPLAHTSVSGGAETMDHENATYAWLGEQDKPEDLVVIGAKYRGPRILEH